VFNAEGHLEAFAVASRDVHSRKMAQAETARVQDELAHAVTFREQVMAVLGHDLRNPLSSVLSLADLLQQRADIPDRARPSLAHIKHAALRMNELITTLLDFSRLRFRGGPQLRREEMHLEAVARAVVDELRVAHPQRTIDLEYSGNTAGRWDRGRIAQVLSNLVGNALTHGSADAPTHVALLPSPEEVCVAVTNGGPAIPPTQIDRLFEPFWAPGSAGERRGLGLGLFIVREIVRAHGGSVDVRSTDGSTTFTVRLPRLE
jgi:signal transduction histidine kinase